MTTDDRERRRQAILTALAEVQRRKAVDPDSLSPTAERLLGESMLERLRLGLSEPRH